jgi:hypothetical protein
MFAKSRKSFVTGDGGGRWTASLIHTPRSMARAAQAVSLLRESYQNTSGRASMQLLQAANVRRGHSPEFISSGVGAEATAKAVC